MFKEKLVCNAPVKVNPGWSGQANDRRSSDLLLHNQKKSIKLVLINFEDWL